MKEHQRNLKIYADDPQRLARDQARMTTVLRGFGEGAPEERQISVYALRTLSPEQLEAIWPHLPEPKLSVHDLRAAVATPVPPPCREEGKTQPAFDILFFSLLAFCTGLLSGAVLYALCAA